MSSNDLDDDIRNRLLNLFDIIQLQRILSGMPHVYTDIYLEVIHLIKKATENVDRLYEQSKKDEVEFLEWETKLYKDMDRAREIDALFE